MRIEISFVCTFLFLLSSCVTTSELNSLNERRLAGYYEGKDTKFGLGADGLYCLVQERDGQFINRFIDSGTITVVEQDQISPGVGGIVLRIKAGDVDPILMFKGVALTKKSDDARGKECLCLSLGLSTLSESGRAEAAAYCPRFEELMK